MKFLSFVVSVLLLLATPAMAVEYQGKNIDGRRFAAKAYYSATGGVYNVQVQFKRNRATIYFDNGSQTTITLKKSVITNPNDIEGFGRLGQVHVVSIFSAGIDLDNPQRIQQLPWSNPVGFWRISLEPGDMNRE